MEISLRLEKDRDLSLDGDAPSRIYIYHINGISFRQVSWAGRGAIQGALRVVFQ